MTFAPSTGQPINPSSKPVRRPKIGTVAAALLLALGVLSLGLTPVRTDHDVWWHLKTGKLIAQRGGHLPETDPFTYGSEGVAWHNHEWLAQLAMFGVFRLGAAALRPADLDHADTQGGLRALVLAKTLVLLAAFGLVARTLARAGICPILACLVALLAAMAARWSIHTRPPVLTYLLLALQMHVLARHWPRRRPLGAAGAALFAFALWSNLHGGWLAGLVVLGCFAVGDALALAWHRRGVRAARALRDLRLHALLLAAALLGTLLNPSGWHLYTLTWRVMSASALVRLIPEMQPPAFAPHWVFWGFLVLAVIALLVGLTRWSECERAGVRARDREKRAGRALRVVTPGEGLALLFFAWQAMSHLRHVPLFVIVAALPVGRLLQAGLAAIERGRPRRTLAAALLAAQAALVALIAFARVPPPLFWEPHWPRNRRWLAGVGYEPTQYQDAACDFLLLAEPPGRLWSNLNIGGFLIWRLSPEAYRVFTDSRFDVHGDARQRLEASINGVGHGGGVPDPDWEQVLAELGVNVALLEKATPLVRAMAASPRWVAVHEWTAPGQRWEDGTMIFLRDAPENAAAIARARHLAETLGQLPGRPPTMP